MDVVHANCAATCHSHSEMRATPVLRLGHLGNVLGSGPLLSLDYIELDLLPFCQRPEAAALDRRVMDETVLLSIRGGNEAESFAVIEPLHCACRTHTVLLILMMVSRVRCSVPHDEMYTLHQLGAVARDIARGPRS